MTTHDFLEIDVFATGPFTGNPLAVVAGADELSTAEMQAIAAWTNFSETTFLLAPRSPGADYRVRIFSPVEEYEFAGHPTLGTARAFLELGGSPARNCVLVQECGVGNVEVRIEGDTLSFATPPLIRSGPLSAEDRREILQAFKIEEQLLIDASFGDNGPGWKLGLLDSVETLRGLSHPKVPGLKVAFAALTGKGDPAYELRAFTPTFEDPVTGSANGAMAQWLRTRGDVPERYSVSQGTALGRDGRVDISDEGGQIWVGGRAEVRVRGTLRFDTKAREVPRRVSFS
ncbi:PhzF family phenazine biosynthesis protein [Corynebacterium sp. Marseille-P4321]|uniref:PhzF family phenazine biosynthesis protein n=1 Tax=Corynebacterium sp. Marseille-P4321 TaxID=2736603 RepID=UPI00158B73D7|nr:PhzF family phenazine biosynthesis protein [Corynebacterium sp. Marseille-P4321]